MACSYKHGGRSITARHDETGHLGVLTSHSLPVSDISGPLVSKLISRNTWLTSLDIYLSGWAWVPSVLPPQTNSSLKLKMTKNQQ